jgi:dTDP-L-rhamnose 4-epimerase
MREKTMKISVIGGAGFIGSHLVDALINEGHDVFVFDNLSPQVHGPQVHGTTKAPPEYLNTKAHFTQGDILNLDQLENAIQDADAIYFLAAAVGVGQSMYEIRKYIEINSLGAGNLLQLLADKKPNLKRLIVASSMSIYGEGVYVDPNNNYYYPEQRNPEQLKSGIWEYSTPEGKPLKAIGTFEEKPLKPTSVYAVTKRDHEELFLSVGNAYQIPTVALRFFNVYGSRQALSNPYTGAAAIFSSAILNNTPPQIFEDGRQTRDFIHVSDIVQGLILSLHNDNATGQVFNLGTGRATSILEVAEILSKNLNFDATPNITKKYRVGDIRHCFADISKACSLLGYKPKIALEDGLKELSAWVAQQLAENKAKESTSELTNRNLIW